MAAVAALPCSGARAQLIAPRKCGSSVSRQAYLGSNGVVRPGCMPPRNARASRRRAAVCYCQHSFVLYTKPDCPLCDGLKDKLLALIDRATFMQCCLTGATLEVRDISTNAAWQDAMHLAVPVLAVLDSQQQEVILPRPPPRIPADRLQQHLQQALEAAGLRGGASSVSSSSSSSGSGDPPFTVVSS